MKEKLNTVVEFVKANPGKIALGVGIAAVVTVVTIAAVKYQSGFTDLPEQVLEQAADGISQMA